MHIKAGVSLLIATTKLTFISLIVNTLPMLCICVFIISREKPFTDFTYYNSIDTLILGFLAVAFLLLDSQKNTNEHFSVHGNKLWSTKYLDNRYDQSLG
jgi:hypothetical protein